MKTLPHGILLRDKLVDIYGLVLEISNELNVQTTQLELEGSRAESVKIVDTVLDNLIKINNSLKEGI